MSICRTVMCPFIDVCAMITHTYEFYYVFSYKFQIETSWQVRFILFLYLLSVISTIEGWFVISFIRLKILVSHNWANNFSSTTFGLINVIKLPGNFQIKIRKSEAFEMDKNNFVHSPTLFIIQNALHTLLSVCPLKKGVFFPSHDFKYSAWHWQRKFKSFIIIFYLSKYDIIANHRVSAA